MKTTLIAVLAASISMFGCAATANWGVSAANIYNGNGASSTKVATDTIVYVFDAGILTQGALYDAFSKNQSIKLEESTGYAGTIATTMQGGIVNTQDAAKFAYGERTTLEQTYTYELYFAIVENDKIFLSSTVAAESGGTDTAITLGFGNQAIGSKITTDGFVSVGQWSQVSGGEAPEPTTCSLLLVGLAGMGLKKLRKHNKKA